MVFLITDSTKNGFYEKVLKFLNGVHLFQPTFSSECTFVTNLETKRLGISFYAFQNSLTVKFLFLRDILFSFSNSLFYITMYPEILIYKRESHVRICYI